MDIRSYMAAVPEMDRFLTVDELNADFERIARDHADIATLERVGSSHLGEPISMLTIGTGQQHVLLFACPHPNEPIGAMMVHHLAKLLCEDAALRDGLGYTWNLIACVDPDGTRLNEGWFAGPFTVRNYAAGFYRPDGPNQVEWTFPSFYKTNYFDRSLPESEMLMRVIDRLQPTLMGSLHNAGFGGVYYYLSHDAPALHDILHEMPGWEDLPLMLGEPEMPYAVEYAPAIYKLPTMADGYDYMEANGADLSDHGQGGSSAEYAEQYGTQTLVIEMAYYDDPRVNDRSVSEVNRRDAILASLDYSDAVWNGVMTQYEAAKPYLRTNSTFERAIAGFIKQMAPHRQAQRTWAETDPSTDRPATVAELFSSDQETRFYTNLIQGMVVRMLAGEVATGNSAPVVRQQLTAAQAAFDDAATALEARLDYRAVPIRKLVAVQLGAVLAAAQNLAEA